MIDKKEKVEYTLESETWYKTIVNFTYDWETWVDPLGRLIYSSPSALRTTGYDASEFLDLPNLFLDIVHPADRKKMADHLQCESSDRGATYHFDYRIISKEGNVLWLSHYCVPVNDEQGKYLGRRGSTRDITEGKITEAALKESEERFRRIFEEAHLGIVMVSPTFAFKNVNPAFCRMMGYSAAELKSMKFADITHPDYLAKDLENVKKLGNGDIPFYRTEKQYIRKTGEIMWGEVIVSAIRDDSGNFRYFLTLITDITEKKSVEVESKKAQKLESLNMLSDGITRDFDKLLAGIFGYIDMFRKSELAEMLRRRVETGTKPPRKSVVKRDKREESKKYFKVKSRKVPKKR